MSAAITSSKAVAELCTAGKTDAVNRTAAATAITKLIPYLPRSAQRPSSCFLGKRQESSDRNPAPGANSASESYWGDVVVPNPRARCKGPAKTDGATRISTPHGYGKIRRRFLYARRKAVAERVANRIADGCVSIVGTMRCTYHRGGANRPGSRWARCRSSEHLRLDWRSL